MTTELHVPDTEASSLHAHGTDTDHGNGNGNGDGDSPESHDPNQDPNDDSLCDQNCLFVAK